MEYSYITANTHLHSSMEVMKTSRIEGYVEIQLSAGEIKARAEHKAQKSKYLFPYLPQVDAFVCRGKGCRVSRRFYCSAQETRVVQF